MSDRRTPFRRLLALLRLTLLVCAIGCCGSQADPFGELSHFADKAGELREPEPAIGVDTEDSSVFMVDTEKEGIVSVQKFENVEGAYKAVASTTFKPKDPTPKNEVQGVAIDPQRTASTCSRPRNGPSAQDRPLRRRCERDLRVLDHPVREQTRTG